MANGEFQPPNSEQVVAVALEAVPATKADFQATGRAAAARAEVEDEDATWITAKEQIYASRPLEGWEEVAETARAARSLSLVVNFPWLTAL
jgi:hypothetical protein